MVPCVATISHLDASIPRTRRGLLYSALDIMVAAIPASPQHIIGVMVPVVTQLLTQVELPIPGTTPWPYTLSSYLNEWVSE